MVCKNTCFYLVKVSKHSITRKDDKCRAFSEKVKSFLVSHRENRKKKWMQAGFFFFKKCGWLELLTAFLGLCREKCGFTESHLLGGSVKSNPFIQSA